MTWAIVRNGRLVDFAHHDTLASLAAWVRSDPKRRGKIVMLDDVPAGASLRPGSRVDVTELRVGLATLAER